MSVNSCNSVNSAIMYSMEIIKNPFVITLISTAIMINFRCPFKFKKQCRSLSRTYKFLKKEPKYSQFAG